MHSEQSTERECDMGKIQIGGCKTILISHINNAKAHQSSFVCE